MKILFLFPHFLLPGGAATATINFARALNQKGHRVEILCCAISEEFKQAYADLNFTTISVPTSNTFFYWALLPFWQIKINRALSNYKNYIFFPQVLPSNWWAWIFKLTHKNQKIIWNCNEPSAFIHSKTWIKAIKTPFMRVGAKLFSPLLQIIDVRLEKENNVVICNSAFTASQYKKTYNRMADEIVYPPMEIFLDKILPDKTNCIFTISRLTKFKNVDVLIESFCDFSQEFPNYSLIIAGDGEEKNNLQKLSKEKGLSEKIIFLGKISESKKKEAYQKSKVTVLCSIDEPFGLVPIESMSYGTPVIAHNSGGPKETIIPEKTGFLFNSKNELVDYLKKIISLSENDYFLMQCACRQQAKKFDISILAKKLENVFRAMQH
jgi:glycosyltransferase involved in cell wall biosynthesis